MECAARPAGASDNSVPTPMLYKPHHTRPRPSRHGLMSATRHHSPWRVLTALVTTLAFALMLVVAASHHHTTALDADSCLACGVASHQINVEPPPPTPVPVPPPPPSPPPAPPPPP